VVNCCIMSGESICCNKLSLLHIRLSDSLVVKVDDILIRPYISLTRAEEALGRESLIDNNHLFTLLTLTFIFILKLVGLSSPSSRQYCNNNEGS